MLNIVIALSEEARSVIQHFKLRRLHNVHPFPVYGNGDVQLIVSGMGKLAAATATGYLAGLSGNTEPMAWLNIGIAGGNYGTVGDLVIANQIIDATGRKSFYPTICFDVEIPSVKLVSVDKEISEYQPETIYDMEAAGFYSAAMRFTTSELIYCCKIISDNRDNPASNISRQDVVAWVENKLRHIDAIGRWLRDTARELASELKGRSEYEILLEKYHFTLSQQIQLKNLLQQWFVLTAASPLDALNINNINSTKSLLHALKKASDEIPVTY